MSAGRICSRIVVTAAPEETVFSGAGRMAERQVGTLIVVDPKHPRKPIGVVTDRDIAVRCVAKGLEPKNTPVSKIMSTPAHMIDEDVPVEAAIEKMAHAKARRLIVKNLQGELVGVISLDDILEMITSEAGALSKLLAAQTPHVAY